MSLTSWPQAISAPASRAAAAKASPNPPSAPRHTPPAGPASRWSDEPVASGSAAWPSSAPATRSAACSSLAATSDARSASGRWLQLSTGQAGSLCRARGFQREGGGAGSFARASAATRRARTASLSWGWQSAGSVLSGHSAMAGPDGIIQAPCCARSSDQNSSSSTGAMSSAKGVAKNPGWNWRVARRPPGCFWRSITMTRRPARAKSAAAVRPSAPAPMIAASYRSVTIHSPAGPARARRNSNLESESIDGMTKGGNRCFRPLVNGYSAKPFRERRAYARRSRYGRD